MASIACALCGREIDSGSAAIVEHDDDVERGVWYVPYVEDMRTSHVTRLFHPACFGRDRGIEELVELMHREDERHRRSFWQLQSRIAALERQLEEAD